MKRKILLLSLIVVGINAVNPPKVHAKSLCNPDPCSQGIGNCGIDCTICHHQPTGDGVCEGGI